MPLSAFSRRDWTIVAALGFTGGGVHLALQWLGLHYTTATSGNPTVAQDDTNLEAEWALSNFDRRHQFSTTAMWELPWAVAAFTDTLRQARPTYRRCPRCHMTSPPVAFGPADAVGPYATAAHRRSRAEMSFHFISRTPSDLP